MISFSIGRSILRRVRPKTALLILSLTSSLGWIGCDSYSDIRMGLDADGRAQFDRGMREATPCWSCHDLIGDGRKVGPPLSNLYGRRAGSRTDYAYSSAMRDSAVVWDTASLDAFLADPQAFLPGNRMVSGRLSAARSRSDLIFFLRLATRKPAGSKDG